MNRFLSLALLLAMTAALSGCEGGPVYGEEPLNGVQRAVQGQVLAVEKDCLHLRITDGGDCGLSVDSEAVASTQVLSPEGCPQLEVGRPVQVVFDGKMAETYPAQLGKVFAIYRLDEEGNRIQSDGSFDFGVFPHSLTLTAREVTPRGLTLVCERTEEGGPELRTGERFQVERYAASTNSWQEVPRIQTAEPIIWNDLAYSVPANDTVQWSLDWQVLYGPLEPGQYRVVKDVWDDSGEEFTCYGGFALPA